MIRTQIYITEEQRKGLRKKAYENDTKLSEEIRKAIDEYLRKDDTVGNQNQSMG